MTKTEFIDYVNSFGKKSGEFTRDEIYDIGVAHKSLPMADKSWTNLAEMVGWHGSADSLRSFVNRNSRMQKELEIESEDKNFRDIYAEKTKIRDTYNAYKRNIRDEARIQVFVDEIKNTAKSLSKLPTVNPGKVNSNITQREAILNFSDLHLGPDFKNSYNEYNYDIACKRVSKLVKDTINYCKTFNVHTLHFLNLGDLVAGLIHPTIRLEQSISVVDQIMKAAELVAETLNELQAAAPVITYRSVVDNHSRANASKDQHIEIENFNRIIDWFVEERLKDTSIKFMKDNIDIGIGKFELKNGKKVMFAHGHEDTVEKSFQSFFGVTREFIDYICLAHYHNAKEKSFNGMKVFVNGSIIGCDSYAYGKRLFGIPEQKLLIIDDQNVIDITITL